MEPTMVFLDVIRHAVVYWANWSALVLQFGVFAGTNLRFDTLTGASMQESVGAARGSYGARLVMR